MKVILAEKPSVARDIAAIVGAKTKADGYIHGNGYSVTWAFGHLVQLAMPEAYGAIGFNREHLPILPEDFQLTVRQVKDGKEYKADEGAAKQLRIIESLFAECESIIVATDAGREGELIFRLIYEYLNCKKPFQRLWISSLTDSAIRDGLSNLKHGSEYDNLYKAAMARSKADWLVGINASQALSLVAGQGVYSLGRVQTPTLAMICNRYNQNKNFTPSVFYKIDVELDGGIVATSAAQYDDPTEAETRCKEILQNGSLTVKSVEQKQKTENAPLLYDITSLQKDANKRFGYSAQETLSIAQTLYEKKFITYPRTGSRYIPDDVFDELETIISMLNKSNSWSEFSNKLVSEEYNKNSVDASKVTDHHAILATNIEPKNLSEKENNVYTMIVCRLVESLMPKCVKSSTTIILGSNDNDFVVKSTHIVENGWRAVRGEQDDEQDEAESNCNLSHFSENSICKIANSEVLQKQTTPKPVHTESSLLGAMESASKELEDEQERAAIKEAGIGTPATRASIIETLFARNYIERKGKMLIPTPKGLAVFDAVKDMRIADVQMTGLWENGLQQIENGKMNHDTFNKGIAIYAKQITHELLEKTINMPQNDLCTCPKCKNSKVRLLDKVAKCSDQTCGLIVFRLIAGKKLSDSQTKDLLTKSKTSLIKGFKSKTGKSFNAHVVLNDEFKTSFVFDNSKKTPKKSNRK